MGTKSSSGTSSGEENSYINEASPSLLEDQEAVSPILPEMDAKTALLFPTGKPRETQLDALVCKHCKRTILKRGATDHIRGCLRAKQERARKKKEARDANKAKSGGGKDEDDDAITQKSQKSAKKSAGGEEGTKKGKKRRMDDGGGPGAGPKAKDKEPKKKKKMDKPPPPKQKRPVNVETQCGVLLPNGGQCARSLTCKSHSMGAKRAVPGRSLPYDMLLQAYQKKNQARQQSMFFDQNTFLQTSLFVC